MSKFIVYEGIDGAGKSEAAEKSYNYLKEQGVDCILIREPGSTEIAEQIRKVLLDKGNTSMNKNTEALLFAAARADLVEKVILPAARENKVIICDRYLYTTLVYQGFVRGVQWKYISTIHEKFAPIPDILVVFKIDPQTAMDRVRSSGKTTNRLDEESFKFYAKAERGYETLKEIPSVYTQNPTIIYVDTTHNTKEQTFETLKNTLLKDVIYQMKE